jgi:hypothetical protein
MVLRRTPSSHGDHNSGESEESQNVENIPWWEKLSHSDPKVRSQGHREERRDREGQNRYGRR